MTRRPKYLSQMVKIERALDKMRPKDGHVLAVPTHSKYLAVGGEAAFAQLILTWAQLQSVARMRTFAKDKTDRQIIDLVRRFYGIISVLCSSEILDVTGSVNLTDIFKDEAHARLQQLQGMRPYSGTRGPSVEIICADHISKGNPQALYSQTDEGLRLRNRSEFTSLAKYLLEKTVPEHYLRSIDGSLQLALGGMIYEIFKNTEDHALVDADGNGLSVSIRALKSVYSSPSEDDLQKMTGEFTPLSTFCASLTPRAGKKQIHIFELSIIDSGPGFAQASTGKKLAEMSSSDEFDAVKGCFLSGNTSKKQSGFGEGLPHVMRLMREAQGFLRIRTGRLSLYIDFSKDHGGEEKKFVLETWKLAPNASLAAVCGTLITLVIPLRVLP